ncbi:MAG TPA: germination protein YpeB [Symbiobacteriaceae bacterium]|nr:germination protein YpeB [Symbiobacteriaceae bacterium]
MRRYGYWITGGTIAALVLALWGVWTWRLGTYNRDLSLALEAERQRNFSNMAYHVEQIQSLLGKGLVTSTTRQNMRYMSDVHHHAMAGVTNFTSLPLPGEVSASVGKFLQQTGDFAQSVLRNEAAGRELDARGRAELARLRTESVNLSTQLQDLMTRYNQGNIMWNPPMRFSWSALMRGNNTAGKPATGAQAPSSMVPGGWDQVGASMEKLPVLIYDGPFSDHLNSRAPAMAAPPVTREQAEQQMRTLVPNMDGYRVVGVTDVNGSLPAYSFRLAPAGGAGQAGDGTYTTIVEVSRNGGQLTQMLNSRMVGKAALDLARARELGQEYLERHGFVDMVPTYGQVDDGTATLAYAYREQGVLVYPDQVKVKIALDNGEVLAVDARQYLLSHHQRTLGRPGISLQEAEMKLRPELSVQRTQLTLIPDQAGTGEILAYEFLTTMGDETFLIYINAETGQEEQVLQQIQTDGGTFAL